MFSKNLKNLLSQAWKQPKHKEFQRTWTKDCITLHFNHSWGHLVCLINLIWGLTCMRSWLLEILKSNLEIEQIWTLGWYFHCFHWILVHVIWWKVEERGKQLLENKEWNKTIKRKGWGVCFIVWLCIWSYLLMDVDELDKHMLLLASWSFWTIEWILSFWGVFQVELKRDL